MTMARAGAPLLAKFCHYSLSHAAGRLQNGQNYADSRMDGTDLPYEDLSGEKADRDVHQRDDRITGNYNSGSATDRSRLSPDNRKVLDIVREQRDSKRTQYSITALTSE